MLTKLLTVGNHGNQVDLECLWIMVTKLLTVGNHGNQVDLECLWIMVTKLFTVGKNSLKPWLASGKRNLHISFELLGRFSQNMVGR
jgi:hypothetical protein